MRNFKSGLPKGNNYLKNYQNGTLSYKYKDRLCIKSPIDIAIYLRLIYDLCPGTIIELGSKEGGSALLLRDIASMYDLDCHIWSVDINPVQELDISNITFVKGNVYDLENSVIEEHWNSFKRPILAIDDSAHSYEACLSCLNYFKNRLNPGDFLIIEDGILSELGLKSKYNGGPNRAIKEFMASQPHHFEIAAGYCDMFGKNVTYHPNGYLRKI